MIVYTMKDVEAAAKRVIEARRTVQIMCDLANDAAQVLSEREQALRDAKAEERRAFEQLGKVTDPSKFMEIMDSV